MQLPKFLSNHKIKKHLTKKRIFWYVVLIVVVLGGWWFFFGRNNSAANIQTGTVKKQDIKQTVLATGQVISGTDLSLGFQSSGVVTRVNVKEGDTVYQGQVLASLNQSTALANLTSAQGSLAQAQANYDKLSGGATPEDIKISEDSVVSAQQDLDNEYLSAKTTLSNAYAKMYGSYNLVSYMKNTYFGATDQQGIKVLNAKNDIQLQMDDAKTYIDSALSNSSIDEAIIHTLNSLHNTYNDLTIVRDQCDIGAYYTSVSSADKDSIDTQKSSINTVTITVDNLQQAIASYKIALQKTKNQLALKKAPATQPEIDAAKGQILSAQGQVDAARAALGNLIIVAPTSGTVTQVNIKVGQQASAFSEAIVLQNISDLHTEANISEANIASLLSNQEIDYTFDALGPEKHFKGNILTINPASTVISGVVNYKVKGSLDNVQGVKPGMTVNMTILVAEKQNTLAVPYSAIISKNNKQYVRVIDDPKEKTYHEVEVTIGLQADGGLVEILSGVPEGQEVVTYIKK